MKILLFLTVTTICLVHVNAEALGPITNRQRIYDQYLSLKLSVISSSNTCNLDSLLDPHLFRIVKPELNQIIGCLDEGETDIMAKYSNFDNVLANPNYLCETYVLTHNCIRKFIPYLSLCLDNVQNSTVAKLYAGSEIGLDILCENNGDIFSMIFQNRHKKCIKHFIRRYDQKFKDIWGLPESELFSSEYSCTILSLMVRKIQNRPPHCNQQLANMLKSVIENFWTRSGCSNVITFS